MAAEETARKIVETAWQNEMNADDEVKLIVEAIHQAEKDVLKTIRELVNEQAKDEGLWFIAQTAPEGYLQQELRRLHVAIEEG